MPLFVAGLSHRNAPVELREQLAVEEDKLREVLARSAGERRCCREVVVLSTCNRVEVYGVAEAPGEARALAFRHLCRQRGVELGRRRAAPLHASGRATPSATPSAWPPASTR